jgi:hypothetical protein
MNLQIIWENPTRNLISRAEFGKGMSFKNKLGCKPATLDRTIHITMPDKIDLKWKRELERSVTPQFQKDKKATIHVDGLGFFVASARNPIELSNRIANGVLEIRGNDRGLNHIDKVTEQNLRRSANLK